VRCRFCQRFTRKPVCKRCLKERDLAIVVFPCGRFEVSARSKEANEALWAWMRREAAR